MTPAGGRTPGIGGRTPGGRTPFGRTPGGSRTPGLGWHETPATSAFHHGHTPRGSRSGRWDATPGNATPHGTSSSTMGTPYGMGMGMGMGVTPGLTPMGRGSRWDATPDIRQSSQSHRGGGGGGGGATPSNYDKMGLLGTPAATPHSIDSSGVMGLNGLQTPMTPSANDSSGSQSAFLPDKIQSELLQRNLPMSDEYLDEIFEDIKGYEIIEPPEDYVGKQTPLRALLGAPTPGNHISGMQSVDQRGFLIRGGGGGSDSTGKDDFESERSAAGLIRTDDGGYVVDDGTGNGIIIKAEDYANFESLINKKDEDVEDNDEKKQRTILRLILKVKNGTPPQRKSALRQLSDKARYFGAKNLFDKILPLLMAPTLEDQERHLLVKVIDRILYKLDDLVRSYVHKILVVIEPLLIDEDYYARVEGREIIANLSKAAGLATMITTMRPDIDNADEYVRNTTARAFSVVASALGIHVLIPFLKAVCQSKKSWEARFVLFVFVVFYIL